MYRFKSNISNSYWKFYFLLVQSKDQEQQDKPRTIHIHKIVHVVLVHIIIRRSNFWILRIGGMDFGVYFQIYVANKSVISEVYALLVRYSRISCWVLFTPTNKNLWRSQQSLWNLDSFEDYNNEWNSEIVFCLVK